MNIRHALAANIRSLRARKDISQQEVADAMRALGFTEWRRQTLGSAEHGSRRVSIEELFGLADVLGTTISQLVDPSPNGTVFFPNEQEVVSRVLL